MEIYYAYAAAAGRVVRLQLQRRDVRADIGANRRLASRVELPTMGQVLWRYLSRDRPILFFRTRLSRCETRTKEDDARRESARPLGSQ